mmetsp:Transcript_6087/g.8496  ORF Transcript_6087/g.8496 Transcript_6087/m.8496 type:complete len:582 (+) Transcript_6087:109-1854(+)
MRSSKTISAFLLAVSICLSQAGNYEDLLDQDLLATYDYCTVVAENPDPQIILYWTSQTTTVDIALKAKTTGWVAFGVGNQMPGSDIVRGYVSSGVAHVADAYINQDRAACNTGAQTGACDDTVYGVGNSITNSGGSENSTQGTTIIYYTRPYAASDARDLAISTSGATNIVYAARSTDDLASQHNLINDLGTLNFNVAPTCPSTSNGTCNSQGTCVNGCCVCNPPFFNKDCSGKPSTGPTLTNTVNPSDYQYHGQVSSSFDVYWNMYNTTIEIAIICDCSGWVGFGPSKDLEMINSDPIIGWIDSNGDPAAYDYYITARSSSGVKADSNDASYNVLAYAGSKQGGKTHIKWLRSLTSPNSNDISITNKEIPVVYGYHPTKPGPSISEHNRNTKGTAKVNFYTGSFSLKNNNAIEEAHGFLMFFAWSVFIPVTSFIARYLKKFKWWFNVHRIVNSGAMVIGLVAFILALVFCTSHFDTPHKIIGLVVTILGILQPILGVVADKMFDPNREKTPIFPDKIHWLFGWSSLILGLVNVFLGLVAYGSGTGLKIAYLVYAILLGVFLLGYFIFALATGKKTHHIES